MKYSFLIALLAIPFISVYGNSLDEIEVQEFETIKEGISSIVDFLRTFVEEFDNLESKVDKNSADIQVLREHIASLHPENLPVFSDFERIEENTTESGWIFLKTGQGNNYRYSITQNGNPGEATYISGDARNGNAYLQKEIDLTSLGDSPLYLSVDFKATSQTHVSAVTNARINILNENSTSILSERMAAGGTTNTGWRTHELTLTDLVQNNDSITVQLWLNDSWSANWGQTVTFDNFILDTSPIVQMSEESGSSGAILPLEETLSFELELFGSEYIMENYYPSVTAEQKQYIKNLISNFNMTQI